MAKTYLVGRSMALLLNIKRFLWKYPFYFIRTLVCILILLVVYIIFSNKLESNVELVFLKEMVKKKFWPHFLLGRKCAGTQLFLGTKCWEMKSEVTNLHFGQKKYPNTQKIGSPPQKLAILIFGAFKWGIICLFRIKNSAVYVNGGWHIQK